MLVPLYGFVQGDSLGVVVLVHDTQKVRDLMAALWSAAAPRVAPAPRARVYHRGAPLALDDTIAQSGIEALDRVDLRQEGDDGV